MIKYCFNCHKEYQANTEDQKICFPCFQESTGQRQIARDEIVIDIDAPDSKGCMCVSAVGMGLFNDGYHFELWYASGQKQPHIHIKGIPHIAELSNPALKAYKVAFLEKYIPREFWDEKIPDRNLCNINHLVAAENKPHFKYKTLKTLRSDFNTHKLNYCDMTIYNQVCGLADNKPVYASTAQGSGVTAQIIRKISILEIAQQFGLHLHGNKTLCPFHADSKTPSLVFYPEQGRFYCFGCNESGNIIKFYALLKGLKPTFKYSQAPNVAAGGLRL